MSHIALYRSWRPQTFQEIVGQNHITQTLQNSLKEGRLTHAYLFSGPRGTGKTSAAKILAKAINCERSSAGEPCNQCASCIRITEGSVMDVIELDAASNNGVDEIRDIRDKVKYAPTEVRHKVYIIDEVHMLSIGASNALLKTLEEPPPHVMFILATTEPHKLPVTIISRCQRFDFRRVAMKDQIARLQYICGEEGISADIDALEYIARLSDGGMRDALSLVDQIISFTGQHITYEGVLSITGGVSSDQFQRLASAVQNKDIGQTLRFIDELMQEGKSADRCIESLIHYFRDLLMIKMIPDSQTRTHRILNEASFSEMAAAFSNERIFEMIDILNHYQVEMKYASQPQTMFEVAVMKICSQPSAWPAQTIESADSIDRLVKKVAKLEQQIAELSKLGRQNIEHAKSAESASSPETASAGTAAAGTRPEGATVGTAFAQTKPILASQQTSQKGQKSLGQGGQGIGAAGLKKGTTKLNAFLSEKDGARHKEATSQWSQVLSRVKEQKVTVHAWLVDGEPVSATKDTVLVVFKNTIHRETTEKPGNKQLVEQVMTDVLGRPLKLETLMQKDWSEAAAGMADADEPKEMLQLEPEDERSGNHKEEWINEAIQIFGEDLVSIKEN